MSLKTRMFCVFKITAQREVRKCQWWSHSQTQYTQHAGGLHVHEHVRIWYGNETSHCMHIHMYTHLDTSYMYIASVAKFNCMYVKYSTKGAAVNVVMHMSVLGLVSCSHTSSVRVCVATPDYGGCVGGGVMTDQCAGRL